MFSRKDLTRLMVPLLIEQILAVLVGMIDVVMVGVVGEAAVSGVSLVDSINMMIIQVMAALCTGGSVIASQYLGAGRKEEACSAADQLISFSLIFILIITAISLIGNNVLLRLIFGSVEEAVMYNARVYFYITALSFPFLAVYNAGAAICRSMGNSGISMRVSLLMNGINIAGNIFCIYVLHMGVEGVAIPTLIARAAAAVVILHFVRNESFPIHTAKHIQLKLELPMVKRILHIGVPNGLENSMFQLGKLLLQSLVSTLGTRNIAAFAVGFNIANLEYLPGTALGLGLITITGQCVGAGEYREAEAYTKKVILINYAILLPICLLLVFFIRPVATLYGVQPDTIEIVRILIIIHSLGMAIWPIAFTLGNTLRSAGDVTFTMITAIASMWIFRIGFSYLFIRTFHLSLPYVWIAMMIDWVFRAALFWWRFKSGRWKKIQIL